VFNFGVRNLVLKVSVTKLLVIHPSEAYTAPSRMYKAGGNYQLTDREVCILSQVHG
jgi:hypothetical protein